MMFANSQNNPNKKLTIITKMQSTVNRNITEIQDVTLNDTDDQNNFDTPIHLAVKQNCQEIVKQLISDGVDVNIRGKDRKTALHLSVAHNLPNIAELLLKNRADPDIKDINGKTSLHWACFDGNVAGVDLLLDYGADINVQDNFGDTPITSIQPSNNTWNKLQFHVVKLQTANMPVSELNENHIKKCTMREMNYATAAELRRFENKAVEESLKMETVPIALRTSLADVLQMSTNKLSIFKSNDEFEKVVFAKDLKKRYPIYADLIKACYRKGIVRSDLVSSTRIAFRKILGLLLPDDCCDLIFHYLDNDNLHNLKESAEIIMKKRKIFFEESNKSIQVKKAKRISE